MLTVVRSPEPCVPLEAVAWPADAAELLAHLQQQPERCHWITARAGSRRVIEAQWAAEAATLLPRLSSLDAFTLRLTLRADARPVIRPTERLVRLAQAWHEITGNSPGPAFLVALDRFVRDWQRSALPPPARPGDFFDSTVQHYLRGLDADGVHDEPAHLAALVHELGIEATPLPNALAGARLVLFDGFFRFDLLHLRLITELSRRIEVLVWLPVLETELADEMLAALRRRRLPLRVIEHVATSESAFAATARSLFSPAPAVSSSAVPGLFKLEAATAREEVEQVARRIKADVRSGESGERLSLGDVAIVAPDETYAALVAEVLPRHGLSVDDGGIPVRVGHTRAARLLASAWQVLRGQWRYETLRDFLVQPIVRRRLDDPERLDHLFEHRPRAWQQRTSATWLSAWQRLAHREADRLAGMESGAIEVTGRDDAERARRLADQRALAAGLARLLASLRRVLEPIIAMEAALEAQASNPTALPELARACLGLFDVLAFPEWLAHPQTQPRDVQRYAALTSTLRSLAESPRHRARASSLWQPDALDTLRGVLDAVVVPTQSQGEGVRVCLLDEAASLRPRQVYVLGLQEGVQPAPAEADALLPARVRNSTLRAQLRQHEAETRGQFRALFERAGKRLVLSRPVQREEDRARPSPFLQAVEACVTLPRLEPLRDITGVREASRVLGRAFAARGARHGGLAEFWPAARGEPLLAGLCHRLGDWYGRDGWPRRNHLDARALLNLRFPEELAFSASDLETYAACPFRYFSQRLLGLEERDADQARTHYGSLVHRVLQAFYDEQRESGTNPAGEPLRAVGAADAPRLRELFDREWRRLGEGVIPPDLRTLFTSEQGVLQLFLDTMAKLESEHGNLRNEFAVENVRLGEDAAGRPVFVSGRIDRIDRHRRSEHAIILDYKTGRSARPAERKAKTEDGRLLQLPLYAAALSIDQGMPVVGGAYVHLHDRAVKVDQAIEAAGDVTWEGARAVDVPFDPEAARQKAIELAGRIRSGEFSLTAHVHGQPHSECSSFCPLRHACRSPEGYKTISL